MTREQLSIIPFERDRELVGIERVIRQFERAAFYFYAKLEEVKQDDSRHVRIAAYSGAIPDSLFQLCERTNRKIDTLEP